MDKFNELSVDKKFMVVVAGLALAAMVVYWTRPDLVGNTAFHSQMGRGWKALGEADLEKAEKAFSAALSSCDTYHLDHSQKLSAMLGLIHTYRLEKKTDDLQKLQLEYDISRGWSPTPEWNSHYQAAVACLAKHDTAGTLAAVSKANAEARRHSKESPLLATASVLAARAYLADKKYIDAEREAKTAVEVRAKLIAAGDVLQNEALELMARSLIFQKRNDEAAKALERSLAVTTKQIGADNDRAAATYIVMAGNEIARGNTKAATDLLSKSSAIYQKTHNDSGLKTTQYLLRRLEQKATPEELEAEALSE